MALNIAPPKAEPSIDLTETAALCSAISRLASRAVRGLLVRTAGLLEASGVVVWMAAGGEVFPVAWHGYDSKQLLQLGPIGRSSLNATAAAWRTGALQSVAGGRLLNPPSWCRCSEWNDASASWRSRWRRDAKQKWRMQAVAAMIAAQLVTVLGAWPATARCPRRGHSLRASNCVEQQLNGAPAAAR